MCATKKLSEICEIVNWWTPDTWNSSYWDGDILWITPKDMWKLEDVYVSDTFRKITEKWLKNSSAKLFPQNSIILSSRAPIWHLAINTVPMCTNQGCKWLIPWKDLDAKYSYYFLLNSVDLLNSLWTGTTFKELSSTKLKEIQIPLPPLSTQLAIVARLDSAMVEIDEARRQTKSALASAREVWESTLESVFAGGGEGWEGKRFDEVCVLQRWYDLPTHERKEGTFALVSSNGITDRIDQYKVKAPWVVTWRSWTIWNVHFIDEDFWPLNTALYIKDFHWNNEKCVFYFLKQFNLGKYSSWAGVPTLNRNNVHCERVSFPPIPEQSRIVAHLDAVRAETESLERLYREKFASLDELRRSILQEAFS